MLKFSKVTLAGVGLLGGTLGLCLQKFSSEVMGYVRRPGSIEECLRLGVTTQASMSAEEAFSGADLVVFCTPVSMMPILARQALPFLKSGTIVTDVGSTKRELVGEMESIFQPAGIHYVGAHPMAGSEKTGSIHAFAGLFHHTLCLLTPTERTDPTALQTVQSLWMQVGCKTVLVDPARHDELVCRASHLPHVLATALVHHVLGWSQKNENTLQPKICASGFRDTTRVASGSPDMWRDIVLSNRAQLIQEWDAFMGTMQGIRQTLDTGSPEDLYKLFLRAQTLRNEWLDAKENSQ